MYDVYRLLSLEHKFAILVQAVTTGILWPFSQQACTAWQICFHIGVMTERHEGTVKTQVQNKKFTSFCTNTYEVQFYNTKEQCVTCFS
jgi:hypothetical protein